MATNETASLADVIKGAIHDAQELVRSEITLAKTEARQEISRLSAGAAMLAGAAVAGLLGLVFLFTAIAWAISELLLWPAWAGFAIVTLVMLLAAGALFYAGRSRMRADRRMPHTVDTMKENMKWMRARTS